MSVSDRHVESESWPIEDAEMAAWAADWSGGATDVDMAMVAPSEEERRRIRRRVRRHGWGLWGVTVLEVLVSVAAVVWVGRLALTEPTTSHRVLFGGVLVLLVVAHGVTLWNRRGTWNTSNRSIRAFAELEVLRLRRQLRSATRLVPAFLLFELILLVPWRLWDLATTDRWTEPRLWKLAVAVLVATGGVLLVCRVWARIAQRRLTVAEQVLETLRPDDEIDPEA